MKKLCGFIN